MSNWKSITRNKKLWEEHNVYNKPTHRSITSAIPRLQVTTSAAFTSESPSFINKEKLSNGRITRKPSLIMSRVGTLKKTPPPSWIFFDSLSAISSYDSWTTHMNKEHLCNDSITYKICMKGTKSTVWVHHYHQFSIWDACKEIQIHCVDITTWFCILHPWNNVHPCSQPIFTGVEEWLLLRPSLIYNCSHWDGQETKKSIYKINVVGLYENDFVTLLVHQGLESNIILRFISHCVIV